jgi:hypothetical protein
VKSFLSQGFGSEHHPPGTNASIAPTQQVSPEALAEQSRYNDYFLNSQPEVSSVAGAPEGVPDPFRGRPAVGGPAGVRLTVASKSKTPMGKSFQSTTMHPSAANARAKALAATSLPQTSEDVPRATLKSWIQSAPQKLVDYIEATTDGKTKTWVMNQIKYILTYRPDTLALASTIVLLSEPMIRQYLTAGGMDIQKYLPSHGYGRGKHKRKRSVSRGRGAGRGRASSNKRHRHHH